MQGLWLIAYDFDVLLPDRQLLALFSSAGLAALCVRAARRGQVNRRCALALGSVFVGLVALSLALMGPRARPEATAWLVSALIWIALGCMGVALVLSLLGLAQIARQRERSAGGKSLGYLALLLSATTLAVFWAYRADEVREALGEARPTVETKKPPSVELIKYYPLNFRYQPPGDPWEHAEPSHVNPESCLAMRLSDPRLYFAIIATSADDETAGDTEALARSAEWNLRAFLPDAQVLEEHPVTVGTLEGRRLRLSGSIQGVGMTYDYWVYAGSGHDYQLVAWGETEHESRLRQDFEKLYAGFEILDRSPTRRPPPVADVAFRSSRYGYSMKLPRTWNNWPRVKQTIPEAESGGRLGKDVALAVIPVRLLGTTPHPEMLVQAFFSAYEFNDSTQDLAPREPVRVGDMHGSAFSLERDSEGERFRYRLLVLQGDDCAYFICAWVKVRFRHGPHLLENAVASVTFQPVEPIADLKAFSEAERDRHASIFNELGLAYYRAQQYARSEIYFKLALEADGTEATYVKNSVEALLRHDEYGKALKLIEANLDRFANPGLRAQRAWIQAELGRTEVALKGYAELFDSGYREDDYFSYYVSKLEEAGRLDEAVTRVTSYAGDRENLDLRILKAHLLSRQEKYAGAIELLEQARKNAPYHPGLRYEMIDVLRAAGRTREALVMVEDMVEEGFDSAQTFYLRATLEYDLKWYSRAKTSLEAALAKAPMNPEARSFLDHVSGILGEGMNSLIKKEIEAVAWPETLNHETERPVEAEGFGAVYLWRATATRFRPGEEYRSSRYHRVAILDDRGASQFSTIEVNFDPLAEEIHVNRLEVFDASGQAVAKGNPDDYFVVDEASGPIITQSKTLNIPVPGLKAGHQIEFVVTRRRTSPPDRFPFVAHVLSSQIPVHRSALFVDATPKSKLEHSAPEGVVSREVAGGTLWEHLDPLAYVWEPYQAEAASFLPTLYLGSSERSWKTLARGYLDDIEDRLTPPDSTRDLARQIVAGATSPVERAHALIRYVQANLTYKAIEFGRRAIIMDATPRILKNRYGDCKDHSLVLMQLLRSVGIEAHLALINTKGPVVQKLPSLGQFDHMIVYIDEGGKGRFVDTTDKDSNPSIPIPYGLAGKPALVLDLRRPRFVELPPYPRGSSSAEIERKLRLSEKAEARIIENVTFRGYYASFMRGYLKGHEPSRRKQAVQDLLATSGFQVLVKKLSVNNLGENHMPLVLELECETENAFHAVGDVLTGNFPSLWAAYYLAPARVEERKTPFRILFPLDFKSRTVVSLPEGYRSAPQHLQSSRLDSVFGRLELKTTPEAGRVVVDVDFELRAGRHPAPKYPDFVRMYESGRRTSCPVLAFEREKATARKPYKN